MPSPVSGMEQPDRSHLLVRERPVTDAPNEVRVRRRMHQALIILVHVRYATVDEECPRSEELKERVILRVQQTVPCIRPDVPAAHDLQAHERSGIGNADPVEVESDTGTLHPFTKDLRGHLDGAHRTDQQNIRGHRFPEGDIGKHRCKGAHNETKCLIIDLVHMEPLGHDPIRCHRRFAPLEKFRRIQAPDAGDPGI